MPALRHPHQVLKTDEMIFSVHLGHLDEVTDPVRYLCRQLEHDDGPPLLMSASVEEMREYLRRFHSLPANTLWLFAERGHDPAGLSLRFPQAAAGSLGQGREACLSRRFSDIESLDRRNLRMVDMAEQMLFDMGLDGAQVFFHTLADRVTTLARIQVPSACGAWCSTCSRASRRRSRAPSSIW